MVAQLPGMQKFVGSIPTWAVIFSFSIFQSYTFTFPFQILDGTLIIIILLLPTLINPALMCCATSREWQEWQLKLSDGVIAPAWATPLTRASTSYTEHMRDKASLHLVHMVIGVVQ